MRSIKTAVALALALTFVVTETAESQSSWERRRETAAPPLVAFHSTAVANLPTAETLQKDTWQFEISHRFLPPFSDGSDAFFGLDGPVYYRLGLGYAPTSQLMITIARSNLEDNLDLQLKYKLISFGSSRTPVLVAVQGGAAWNSQVTRDLESDGRKAQYYAQLIANIRFSKTFAFGVIPTYLYNFAIYSEEVEHALTVGLVGQVNITNLLSIIGEWSIQKSGFHFPYDAATFGIELETGGHFFKIIATNSTRINPSQYTAGADEPFEPDNWRLGFCITRLLKF